MCPHPWQKIKLASDWLPRKAKLSPRALRNLASLRTRKPQLPGRIGCATTHQPNKIAVLSQFLFLKKTKAQAGHELTTANTREKCKVNYADEIKRGKGSMWRFLSKSHVKTTGFVL